MDQQVSSGERPGGLFARLRIIGNLVSWLADLIRLTDDQKKDAGIYLGDQR